MRVVGVQVELNGTRVPVIGDYEIEITNGVDSTVSVPVRVVAGLDH